jgi:3-phosphoshikimate 1-carboxyvinyltransferase
MNKKPPENGILFAKDGKTVTVMPGSRSGRAYVPSSKSVAHRMLICAALSETPSHVECDFPSADIEATKRCIEAMKNG